MKNNSLSKLLKHKQKPLRIADFDEDLKKLQEQMLRIQQGVWHGKQRVIVVFEGFDAAGKGGAIRRMTEILDPRGVRVHAISAPDPKDQAKHYLYRFWKALPEPGTIAIFDRSWYGRVLVERVEGLTSKKRWKEAFDEINDFESTLMADGIRIIKIFIAISKEEQLKRYEERLKDPYKQWKLGPEDLRNRKHWDDYVEAADEMLKRTSTKNAPWFLVPGDHKPSARHLILEKIGAELADSAKWIKTKAARWQSLSLEESLKKIEKKND